MECVLGVVWCVLRRLDAAIHSGGGGGEGTPPQHPSTLLSCTAFPQASLYTGDDLVGSELISVGTLPLNRPISQDLVLAGHKVFLVLFASERSGPSPAPAPSSGYASSSGGAYENGLVAPALRIMAGPGPVPAPLDAPNPDGTLVEIKVTSAKGTCPGLPAHSSATHPRRAECPPLPPAHTQDRRDQHRAVKQRQCGGSVGTTLRLFCFPQKGARDDR